jgi:hypothetical protein
VATGYGVEGVRKSVARLNEPEFRVQRAGESSKPRRDRSGVGQRPGLAVDELDVPEFIPNT